MENKKLILVIEDEEPIVRVLTKKLIQEGYEVISARNGQEGINTALKYKPDIILLDIVMPVLDGVSMLKILRDDPWGKNVEVIVLTNLTDAAKNAQALTEGVKDYLIKTDWNLAEVAEKIKQRLAYK